MSTKEWTFILIVSRWEHTSTPPHIKVRKYHKSVEVGAGQNNNSSPEMQPVFSLHFHKERLEIVLLPFLLCKVLADTEVGCGQSLFQMPLPHHTSSPRLKGWSSSFRRVDRWPELPESSARCQGSTRPHHPDHVLPRPPAPRHPRPPPAPHRGCYGNSTPTQWWRLWQQCSWKTITTYIYFYIRQEAYTCFCFYSFKMGAQGNNSINKIVNT